MRLIEKLRTFSNSLEPDERVLLGVLIAPGVLRAYDAPEVMGFEMVEWTPDALAASLGEAFREAGITVTGLFQSDGAEP